jgi:hypothetical protein
MSFQTLVLNNIQLMGYNHQNNFFGEKSFHYSTTKTLSIRGYVLDLTNTVGVKDILLDTSRIKSLTTDFQNIIINGVNFGIGKFVSLSFDNENWVRSTQFDADIEIYETANLQSLVSKEFTGINLSGKRLDLIRSLNENFNLDFDNNSKILGGNHSIDIEYNADNKNLNVISLAQSLAAELLSKSIPANLSEYNYSTRQEGTYRILNNESYDVVNGKCGFRKTFSYSTENTLKPYSVNRNLNINLDDAGFATVNEICNIKAENDKPTLYDNVLIGLNEQITGAYLRCSGFFSNYKSKFNITNNLNSTTIGQNITINKYDGTLEYNIGFSNDNKYSQPYTFEYISTLDRDSSYIWTVSEEGSVLGIGERTTVGNSNSKYIGAENGWNIVKTGILSRSQNLWQDQPEKASNNFNLINENISRSPFNGRITYNYKYTDDPKIRTDLGNIKKLEIEFSDNGSAGTNLLPIYTEFIIPNTPYTLIQNRNFKKQGVFSVSAKAQVTVEENTVFNSFSYLDILKQQVRANYFGGSQDKYLESAEFSSDEIEQSITYTENYKYS